MNLYSQKDPAYSKKHLGKSKLTVHGYGCFVCSIATLYQIDPAELLEVPKAFTKEGLLDSSKLAQFCGGEVTKKLIAPDGWCIAMTDHYKDQGFETHFFCVNTQTNEMVDPLKFPARIEPISYKIKHYRVFTNTVLDTRSVRTLVVAKLQNALKFAKGLRKRVIERLIERLSRK